MEMHNLTQSVTRGLLGLRSWIYKADLIFKMHNLTTRILQDIYKRIMMNKNNNQNQAQLDQICTVLEGLLVAGLLDITVDENGEFFFSLTAKGETEADAIGDID